MFEQILNKRIKERKPNLRLFPNHYKLLHKPKVLWDGKKGTARATNNGYIEFKNA